MKEDRNVPVKLADHTAVGFNRQGARTAADERAADFRMNRGRTGYYAQRTDEVVIIRGASSRSWRINSDGTEVILQDSKGKRMSGF